MAILLSILVWVVRLMYAVLFMLAIPGAISDVFDAQAFTVGILDVSWFKFIVSLFVLATFVVTAQLYIKNFRLERTRPKITVTHHDYNNRAILEITNNGGPAEFRAYGRILGDKVHAPQRYLMYWDPHGGSVRIPSGGTETLVIAEQMAGPSRWGLSMMRIDPDPTKPQFFYAGTWRTSQGSPIGVEDVLTEISVEPNPPLSKHYRQQFLLKQPSITTLKVDPV